MTWDRRTAVAAVPVAAVAVIAAIQSYSHIEALALAQHQSLADARMLPFAVDFLIVAGSVILLAGYWLGWLGVVLGIVATLFANIASGLPYGPLAATVAAWPAVAFSVASFMLERWLKRQAGRGGTGGSQAAGPGGIGSLAGSAEAFPEPPLATLKPPPASCGHLVAGTAEENVVRIYLHERDCLGQTPSQRRLAATYGLSRPKVAQLVAPLNGGSHD
jgi:Protein of unknown function (DUF2637)